MDGTHGIHGSADAATLRELESQKEVVLESQKEVVIERDNPPQVVWPTLAEHHELATEAPGPPRGKKICGLATRAFYMVAAVVALVLLAAIIGGAVGGTKAANNKDPGGSGGGPPVPDGLGAAPGGSNSGPGSNSTSSNRNSVLAANSRVAAVNWVSGKVAHHAVFSQDKYDALMVSLFDAENQTWTSVNISQALARGGNPIVVKRGTNLAGVTATAPWPFQMNLYYTTPSGSIGELFSKDNKGLVWGVGELATQAKFVADNGQMTGYWSRCEFSCSGDISLLYEDPQNNLVLLNGSDWSNSTTVMPKIDPGSGLALTPFITDDGRNGSNAGEYRLYINQKNTITELSWVNRTWSTKDFRLASNVNLTPQPQMVSAPFDGFFQILVVARNADGSVTGYRWDRNKTWNVDQKIKFSNGGPTNPNFGYIAQDGDGRFYGTMDGEIHEYRWYTSDPLSFLWVGKVGILNGTSAAG